MNRYSRQNGWTEELALVYLLNYHMRGEKLIAHLSI